MRLWETVKKYRDDIWVKALSIIEWPFGCEVLMRDVSIEYTERPSNYRGEELLRQSLKNFGKIIDI